MQYAELDTEALVVPNLIMAKDRSYATLKEEALKEIFYADCSDEDVEFAKSQLVPQATGLLATRVSITEKNFGRVPRVYISCLRDKALSPSIQEKLYKALPCEKVIFFTPVTHHFFRPQRS
jgi:hypothetical protein